MILKYLQSRLKLLGVMCKIGIQSPVPYFLYFTPELQRCVVC